MTRSHKNKAKKKEYNSRPEVKAHAKEYQKEYYQKNKEKLIEKAKEYRSRPENKEQQKAYDSRPEVIARKKEYYSRPEVKANKKEVRDRPENKAKRKEYTEKPEIKAKAQKRNREIYIILTKEKLKYGNMCTCCGLTDIHNLTKDHIVPLSKGGTDTPDNIQLHCFACNCSKGDRLKCTLPHDNPKIKKMVKKTRRRKSD